MNAPKISFVEFTKIMAYIALGTQRPLTDGGAEVYYELLGDLPQAVLQIAAKRAVLEHKYATFPTVAMIRDFAIDAQRGEVKALTGPEAWGIAIRVMGKLDVEYSPDHQEKILAEMPPIVRAAVHGFGFMAIYNLPNDAIETARAQFIRIFESLAERERKTGILPDYLRKQIAAIGAEHRPAAITQAVASIGVEKP